MNMNTEHDFFQQWKTAYEGRLHWAYAARDRFLDDFDAGFRRHVETSPGRGDAFVALYGNTQVGKTTLILKLLGIRKDEGGKYFAEIEDILRAGRKQGKSSTSTAVIYLRSPDEHFHLIRGMNDRSENLDAAQLMAELQTLRHQVETRADSLHPNGDRQIDAPYNIFVKIPKQYFGEDESAVTINIIDLPGLGGDPKEKRHLKYILDRNLPLSTLVVFVAMSNEKAMLLDSIEHDYVRRWRRMPEAFRIVTTHTISNLRGEKRDTLTKIQTKEALVNHVRAEYQRTLGTRDDEMPAIYPLEYGKSWDEKIRPDPDMARFHGIVDELVDDLRQDLQRHVTPHHKIMLTAGMFNALKKEIEAQTNDLEEALNRANEKHLEVRQYKTALKNDLKEVERRISKLEAEIVSTQVSVRLGYTASGNINYCTTQSEYESYIASEIRQMEKLAKGKLAEFSGEDASVKKIIRRYVNELSEYCDQMLWINRFLGGQQDRRRFISGRLSAGAAEIEKTIQTLLTEDRQRQNEEIYAKITKREKEAKRTQQSIDLQRRLETDTRRKAEACENALQTYISQSHDQLQHAKTFQRYIAGGYEQQAAILEARRLAPEAEPESVLLSTLEQALLLEDYYILNQTQSTR